MTLQATRFRADSRRGNCIDIIIVIWNNNVNIRNGGVQNQRIVRPDYEAIAGGWLVWIKAKYWN